MFYKCGTLSQLDWCFLPHCLLCREPGSNYVSIKLLTDLLNNSLSTFIEHARLTKLWQCISVTQWQEERAFTIKSSNTGFTVWKLCYIHQKRAQSTQIFKYFTPGTNSFAFGFRLLLTWGREKQNSSWIVIFILHSQTEHNSRRAAWGTFREYSELQSGTQHGFCIC